MYRIQICNAGDEADGCADIHELAQLITSTTHVAEHEGPGQTNAYVARPKNGEKSVVRVKSFPNV